MLKTITFPTPDDWHIHLRDGAALTQTVSDATKQFARAIVMPNLVPPVTHLEHALAYRKRILDHVPKGKSFEPLMTLYLTDQTSAAMLQEAKGSGIVYGCKLYPAGATTHSDAGVTNILQRYPIFETMATLGIPLLIHGEVTRPTIDVFDREKYFIDEVLIPLQQTFPTLKIVLEHITTQEAVDFVKDTPTQVAATITAHHLLLSRNDLFKGGINPHHYCLPIVKRASHQNALIAAATSGNPKFFLGTDSAPHPIHKKETTHGCAGIYTAHAAIELYTEVFEDANALDKLPGFASFYGADFYGLPRNTTTITLIKEPWEVPKTLPFGKEVLRPLRAGEKIAWRKV